MNRKVQASLDELVASLRRLRSQGEQCRAALYWTVQRIARNQKRAASVRLSLWRRKALRIHTETLSVGEQTFRRQLAPIVTRDYCPPPKRPTDL